jgi:hypothetical protein
MKKFLPLIFFILLANCSVFKKDPSLLFVQSSAKGNFNGKTLVLSKISSHITYFSDRPYRIVGAIKNDKFREEWNSRVKNSFAKDAPNAWISYYDENGKAGSAVIEISNLKMEKDSFSYEVKILEGQLSKVMHNISLVIDDMVVKGYMFSHNVVQGVI